MMARDMLAQNYWTSKYESSEPAGVVVIVEPGDSLV